MAIQSRKIPSPSDIKSTPQSFTSEELNQIKELRNQLNQLTYKFGQYSLSKIKLEETGNKLKEEYADEGAGDKPSIATETFAPAQ